MLERVGALQSEMVFSDIADQIALGQADRGIGLEVACDVLFEGVFLAGRGDVKLGAESVFPRILADDFLTGFGGGARREVENLPDWRRFELGWTFSLSPVRIKNRKGYLTRESRETALFDFRITGWLQISGVRDGSKSGVSY